MKLEHFADIRHSQEYISFLIRFSLGTFSISFIGIGILLNYFDIRLWVYFSASALFYIITFAFFFDLFRTIASQTRRYLTLVYDVSCASFNIYLTIEASNALWLFYIWIYLGYGYRYGKGFVYAAAIITFVQYNIVLLLSNNWQLMPLDSITQLLVLTTLPLYISALVNRLHQARFKAEQASLIKSEFLARMSHEIRTPLSGIIGLSNLMTKGNLTKEQHKITSALNKTANNMHNLIDDILDFSKIEANKLQIQLQKTNIISSCTEVIETLSSNANEKGLDLYLDIADDIPKWVVADKQRIQQILLNLVGNGIKYTNQGSVSLKLSLNPKKKFSDYGNNFNRELLFQISDTGIGISETEQNTIFDSFVQAGALNTVGGSGLGMTISKQLVELMGGKIALTSQLGQGTQVSFTLELKVIPNGAEFYIKEKPQYKSQVIPTRQSINCLIAEDDEVNAMVLKHYLEELKHNVNHAKDGQEAINFLKQQNYDLVLMDMHMPYLTGREVTQAWRQIEPDNQHIPIIGLTADATLENQKDCLTAGMDEFLTKPITPDKLQDVIYRYT